MGLPCSDNRIDRRNLEGARDNNMKSNRQGGEHCAVLFLLFSEKEAKEPWLLPLLSISTSEVGNVTIDLDLEGGVSRRGSKRYGVCA